jgi:glutamate-1-semialdehyde aminotransferase
MGLKLQKSFELLARAKKVLPAQTHTFSKGYRSFVEGVYPVFAQRGKGSHFFDVDGNEFIDYMTALGPIILGYSYDAVNNAIRKQLDDGSIFTLPHPLEVEAAELMCQVIPGCEMAKFAKTGSDAVTAAVRAARAISGKDNVAYWGGGGVWHDWFTVITSRNQGIPKSLKNMIKLFQYNNIESLKQVLDDDKEIGTVCMEPMMFEEPSNNFLQEVKRITHQHDAVLVFDEVQTGFRWSLGGAQERFGVQADISAWGKAMANGMPLGAISGKEEFMKVFEEIFYSTTFGGETLSLASFKATVQEMREKKVIDHIFKIGKKFGHEFNILSKENGLNITVEGLPCKIKLGFLDKDGNDSLLIRSLFCQENIENGVFFWQGPVFHTFSHSEDDLKKTSESIDKSMKVVKKAIQNDEVEKSLRGKSMNRVLYFPA